MKNKVLLIDDIREFLTMLKLMLSRNYEVVTARNGQEALELMQNGYQPDVIITDLYMPYLNGHELVSRVKESDDLKKIPIIVLSESDRKKDKESVLKLGVHNYIQKSFVPVEFRSKLQYSLDSLLQNAS